MNNIEHVLKEISCDKHNIQQMINLIPLCDTKGERRTLIGGIKTLVKTIHNQKVLIDEKLFVVKPKVSIPLFEVEPSKREDIEIYRDLNSFLGNLDDLS